MVRTLRKPFLRRVKDLPIRGVLGAILYLILATLSAEAEDVGKLPMGVPQPSDTMTFTLAGNGGNCNGCEWIAAEGPITQRTPPDFEAFLKLFGTDVDGRETVRLSSNGGNLVAGLELG